MKQSWNTLMEMTGHSDFRVSEVYIPEQGIRISGDFELPSLAKLSSQEQLFAAAFIKTHGSIKLLETNFSISYPTVKNRLNAIAAKLDTVDVRVSISSPVSSVLDKLETGEIDARQALKEITSCCPLP
jgi:hypothetical protein